MRNGTWTLSRYVAECLVRRACPSMRRRSGAAAATAQGSLTPGRSCNLAWRPSSATAAIRLEDARRHRWDQRRVSVSTNRRRSPGVLAGSTTPQDQRFFRDYLRRRPPPTGTRPEPFRFRADEFGRYAMRFTMATPAGPLIAALEAAAATGVTIVRGPRGAVGTSTCRFHRRAGLLRQIRSGRIVSLVDTTPTTLDLLGVPAAPAPAGRSLLDGEPRLALFFADYSLGMLGLRDGPKIHLRLRSGPRAAFSTCAADPDTGATSRSSHRTVHGTSARCGTGAPREAGDSRRVRGR